MPDPKLGSLSGALAAGLLAHHNGVSPSGCKTICNGRTITPIEQYYGARKYATITCDGVIAKPFIDNSVVPV